MELPDEIVLPLVQEVVHTAPVGWREIVFVGTDIAPDPPAVFEQTATADGEEFVTSLEAANYFMDLYTYATDSNDRSFKEARLSIHRPTPTSDDVSFNVHFDYGD